MEWLAGLFPVLALFILCPLMMFFMMRGMHGSHEQAGHTPTQAPPTTDDTEVARLRAELPAPRQREGSRRSQVSARIRRNASRVRPANGSRSPSTT
jgi:hypothetical protein